MAESIAVATALPGEETMSRPVLHVFAISHYCEKARWALDWFGIDYELRHLAPGAHVQVAADLGAPGSSLPLLVHEGRVVHGSGEIIEWAESFVADPGKRLSPEPRFEDECRALEARLDDRIGVHLRRYYYSEAIIEHPESVRPIFTRDLPPEERERIDANWDVVCRLMTGAMDLGPEQWHESRQIFESELDWFDALLSDGRTYLLGDRFSRADLTAAALLAPLALPPEHPTYGGLELPPRAQADFESWSGRPSAKWARQMYAKHR